MPWALALCTYWQQGAGNVGTCALWYISGLGDPLERRVSGLCLMDEKYAVDESFLTPLVGPFNPGPGHKRHEGF